MTKDFQTLKIKEKTNIKYDYKLKRRMKERRKGAQGLIVRPLASS